MQDPRRARALVVADKTDRVTQYQQATVAEAQRILASLGVYDGARPSPDLLMRRVDHGRFASYANLYDWLEPGQLLAEPPQDWAADWDRAEADSSRPRL